MTLERIAAMLRASEGESPPFPPTLLFNENWLLRLVLDWFARQAVEPHRLAPAPGASWYSEAWLPSAFLPRHRRDPLAESWTHADGVVGHFTTGNHGTADLALLPTAGQFVVVEGKMLSRLAAGVKNAPCYDQAARTVACIAEVLRRAGRRPEELDALAFVLIAPQVRWDEGVFADELALTSIRRKVRRRVDDYAGARDAWLAEWFEPTLARIDVVGLSWESVIETIAFHDAPSGQAIDSFYGHCLRFSKPQSITIWLPPRAAPSTSAIPEPNGP